jgi:excisionase family DNA binding protein
LTRSTGNAPRVLRGSHEIADDARLLEASEVAQLLNVNLSWLREATRAGVVPHIRLGKYVRYRWNALESWLAEIERSSTTQPKRIGSRDRRAPSNGRVGRRQQAPRPAGSRSEATERA